MQKLLFATPIALYTAALEIGNWCHSGRSASAYLHGCRMCKVNEGGFSHCPQGFPSALDVSSFQPSTQESSPVSFLPQILARWPIWPPMMPRLREHGPRHIKQTKTKPCFYLCTIIGVNDRNKSEKINSKLLTSREGRIGKDKRRLSLLLCLVWYYSFS